MGNNNDPVDVATHMLQGRRILKHEILGLMDSSEIDVLGVVRHYLAEERILEAIIPPLDFEDLHRFMLRYTEECIFADSESSWASSACLAGHEFVSYVKHQWLTQRSIRQIASELGPWLERIYKRADTETRNTIQLCILEHLFCIEGLSDEFGYWRNDGILQKAYQDALHDASLMS